MSYEEFPKFDPRKDGQSTAYNSTNPNLVEELPPPERVYTQREMDEAMIGFVRYVYPLNDNPEKQLRELLERYKAETSAKG